jgi:glutathione-regulated potassium-efflux system ancillary protein KefC
VQVQDRYCHSVYDRSAALLILFLAKSLTDAVTVYPEVRGHRYDGSAGAYYTLMMSTGLTFGTISSLFGLNHYIITQAQYSFLVGTVIASAVIPTIIANAFFLPRHLLPDSHPYGVKTVEQPAQPAAAETRHK